ncbi:hypothetical protein [Mesorhizobium sp. 2RAF21]|uniref:hypothetical protein n=1 Tax=Mesorhizobium sp. 2RAF21 TaxID=3232995 RepID=UPI003F98EFF5
MCRSRAGLSLESYPKEPSTITLELLVYLTGLVDVGVPLTVTGIYRLAGPP